MAGYSLPKMANVVFTTFIIWSSVNFTRGLIMRWGEEREGDSSSCSVVLITEVPPVPGELTL